MVRQGEITDSMKFDIYKHFMTKDSVYASRNPHIFPMGQIDSVNFPLDADFKSLIWIDRAKETITVSLIVFSDWTSSKGRDIVVETLKAMERLVNTRVAFIDTSAKGCANIFEFEKLDFKNSPLLLENFIKDLGECSSLGIKSDAFKSRLQKIQVFKSLSLLNPGETGFLVNGRVIFL
jgi:hypothetical protein